MEVGRDRVPGGLTDWHVDESEKAATAAGCHDDLPHLVTKVLAKKGSSGQTTAE